MEKKIFDNFANALAEIVADKVVEKMACKCAGAKKEAPKAKKETTPKAKKETKPADGAYMNDVEITLEQMQNAAKEVSAKIGNSGPVKEKIAAFSQGSSGALKDVPRENYVGLLEALDDLVGGA